MSRPGRRPNIMVVVIDCLRADHSSVYGYNRPTTPWLSQLAAAGIVFERAISPAGWSLPAHASLFSGLFPSRHGADDQYQHLDADVPVIAELLAEFGYRTVGLCGNPWVSQATGLTRGFQAFDTLMPIQPNQGTRLFQIAERAARKAAYTALNGGATGGDWAVLRARQWLRRLSRQPEPFFMFIHFNEPHTPHELPLKSRLRFAGTLGKTRELASISQPVHEIIVGTVNWDEQDYERYTALYDAGIAYADSRLGSIVEELRSLGVLDQTVVVVTADHGEALGEHGLLGHKCNLYEPLIHVPLVIRYPEAFTPGTRQQALVQTLDLPPTLLDLAEAGMSTGRLAMQGQSLLEQERTRTFAIAEQAIPRFEMFAETFPEFDPAPLARRLEAIQRGEWKYIWASDGRHELYNLVSDPKEQRSVLEDVPEIGSALHDEVLAWLDTTRPMAAVRPAVAQAVFDDAVTDRLRDLGYIP